MLEIFYVNSILIVDETEVQREEKGSFFSKNQVCGIIYMQKKFINSKYKVWWVLTNAYSSATTITIKTHNISIIQTPLWAPL